MKSISRQQIAEINDIINSNSGALDAEISFDSIMGGLNDESKELKIVIKVTNIDLLKKQKRAFSTLERKIKEYLQYSYLKVKIEIQFEESNKCEVTFEDADYYKIIRAMGHVRILLKPSNPVEAADSQDRADKILNFLRVMRETRAKLSVEDSRKFMSILQVFLWPDFSDLGRRSGVVDSRADIFSNLTKYWCHINEIFREPKRSYLNLPNFATWTHSSKLSIKIFLANNPSRKEEIALNHKAISEWLRDLQATNEDIKAVDSLHDFLNMLLGHLEKIKGAMHNILVHLTNYGFAYDNGRVFFLPLGGNIIAGLLGEKYRSLAEEFYDDKKFYYRDSHVITRSLLLNLNQLCDEVKIVSKASAKTFKALSLEETRRKENKQILREAKKPPRPPVATNAAISPVAQKHFSFSGPNNVTVFSKQTAALLEKSRETKQEKRKMRLPSSSSESDSGNVPLSIAAEVLKVKIIIAGQETIIALDSALDADGNCQCFCIHDRYFIMTQGLEPMTKRTRDILSARSDRGTIGVTSRGQNGPKLFFDDFVIIKDTKENSRVICVGLDVEIQNKMIKLFFQVATVNHNHWCRMASKLRSGKLHPKLQKLQDEARQKIHVMAYNELVDGEVPNVANCARPF